MKTKAAAQPAVSSKKLYVILMSVIVLAAVFMLYSKTVKYGITNLDDGNIVYTAARAYASDTAFIDVFRTNVMMNAIPTTYYRPTVSLTFLIQNRLAGGPSQSLAHATSVILHALSSLLVFLFLRKYFFKDTTAFLAALLFAVHPCAMYTAVWITGINESLFFITFLLSFAAFIEYLNKKNSLLLVLHIVFMFMCFLAKESGIILPFIFFLYYFLTKEKGQKLNAVIYVLWVISIGLFLYMRKKAVPSGGFFINLSADYINMFFDYYAAIFTLSTPFGVKTTPLTVILGILGMGVSAFFAFYKIKDPKTIKRNIFFLVLPVLILAPTVSAADRLWFQGNRMYTPLFAIIFLFFSFLSPYIENKKNRTLAVICVSALLILSSAITWHRTDVFKNAINFWGEIIKGSKYINITAHRFYTFALIEDGSPAQALLSAENVSRATEYTDPLMTYTLAYAYLINENYADAVKFFEHSRMQNGEAFAMLAIANYYLQNNDRVTFYAQRLAAAYNLTAEQINATLNSVNAEINRLREKALQKNKTLPGS